MASRRRSLRYRWRIRRAEHHPSRFRLVAVLGAVLLCGSGVALAATAHADDEVSCTLAVPADPLSAQGLATPYRLLGACHEADPDTAAFVQATIVDPATGALAVYNPLVVDDGSQPAVPPVVPRLPEGAVVGIWFGFNGDNLTLRSTDDSLAVGDCVNGLADSIFGQFAYCNADAFYSAAHAAIAAGKLSIPRLGTGRDGLPCPSTRDFRIVDQDQSDNVTATYLLLPDGRTAQNTAANQSELAPRGATVLANGSDEGLVVEFVDPALGCTPYVAPDLADPGAVATSLALNELQASLQPAPVALVPLNDPMVLVNDRYNVRKTNLYRAGVDQGDIDVATEHPEEYCRSMLSLGIAALRRDRDLTRPFRSPDPATASSLFAFLAARLDGSFTSLRCGDLLGIASPVHLIQGADGVVVDATFTDVPEATPAPSTRPVPSTQPTPSTASPRPVHSTQPTTSSRPTASSRPAPSTRQTPSATRSARVVPATHAPGTPGPATHPTATHGPVTQEPATPEPATHQPVTHRDATHTPAPGQPASSAPAAGPGDPAASPTVAPAAAPATTLPLGAIPYRPQAGSTRAGLPRLAGWSLLTGGGLIAVALLLTSLLRHRGRGGYASADW